MAETPAEIEDHLAQGRPVIALIQTSPGSYHYVVLLAWANGWVIFHDPNVRPFRAMREEQFNTACPRVQLGAPGPSAARIQTARSTACRGGRSPIAVAPDGCDALMEAGILLAQQGDSADAELNFRARSPCAPSPPPLSENVRVAISRRRLGGREPAGGARFGSRPGR